MPITPSPETDKTTHTGATLHRYVACEKCGKRMLVEVNEGKQHHRCPVCGAEFVTSLARGQLSVRWI